MQKELIDWLDSQYVTSDNIGEIRRACSVPWDSDWNAIVRDETAKREIVTQEREERLLGVRIQSTSNI